MNGDGESKDAKQQQEPPAESDKEVMNLLKMFALQNNKNNVNNYINKNYFVVIN